MEKETYIINFFADVDVEIEAETPEEAVQKAREMLGTEHIEELFKYVYLSDINNITTSDGTEVHRG